MNKKKNEMGIAVIGAGNWGKNLIREINHLGLLRMVGYQGNPQTRELLESIYPNVRMTTNLEEIFRNPDINALIVATPIKTHFDMVKRGLLEGKDILVEKPATESIGEFLELVDLARSKGLILSTDHIFAYHPLFAEFAQIVKDYNVKQLNFEWLKNGSFTEDIYANLAYHEIYLAILLMGDPVDIAIYEEDARQTKVDVTRFIMKFTNNKTADFYINRDSEIRSKRVSFVVGGRQILWENNSIFKVRRDNREALYLTKEQALPKVISDFIASVESRRGCLDVDLVSKTLEYVQKLRNLSKSY